MGIASIEQIVEEYRCNNGFHIFTKKLKSVFLYQYAENILNNSREPMMVNIADVVYQLQNQKYQHNLIERYFDNSIRLLIHDGRLSNNTEFKNVLRYVDDRSYNIKKSIRTLKMKEL